MSSYFKRLAALIAASLTPHSVEAMVSESPKFENEPEDIFTPAELNVHVSQILAGHRSHSSHASHGSHRSSSGSSSGSQRKSQPPPPRQQPQPLVTQPQSDPRGQQPKVPGSTPPKNNASKLTEALKDPEARKNIIMRMQLTLQFEKLYSGPVDGVMGPETREAVLFYKRIYNVPGDAVLDAATLNAFGILGY